MGEHEKYIPALSNKMIKQTEKRNFFWVKIATKNALIEKGCRSDG
jgi:hypothetical protein